MTLALHGKPRRRQGLLIASALFAVVAAALAAMAFRGSEPAAADTMQRVRLCTGFEVHGAADLQDYLFEFSIWIDNDNDGTADQTDDIDFHLDEGGQGCSQDYFVDPDARVQGYELTSPAMQFAPGYPKWSLVYGATEVGAGSAPAVGWDVAHNCVEPLGCTLWFYNKLLNEPETPLETAKDIRLCKEFVDNGDGVVRQDVVFEFLVGGVPYDLGPLDEGVGTCEDITVQLSGAADYVTIQEVAQPGWVDAPGYPMYSVNLGPAVSGSSVNVSMNDGCYEPQNLHAAIELVVDVAEVVVSIGPRPECVVTFFNQEAAGEVAPSANLIIEKYVDFNGDGDANDAGESTVPLFPFDTHGPAFPLGQPEETDAAGQVVHTGLNAGDTYTVTELLIASYVTTNVTVNGVQVPAGKTATVVLQPGDNIVRFYNQPLGSITVVKKTVEVVGNSETSTDDQAGWLMTVSSSDCNHTETRATDAMGYAEFTVPPCDDYVVSEDAVNAPVPGYVPAGPTTVTGVDGYPEGPRKAVVFKNKRELPPPCQDCSQPTPTPTEPPATPTAPPSTPTTPPTVPPAATPVPVDTQPQTQPSPVSTVAGETTPGAQPTPIAPSTGTGQAAPSATGSLVVAIGLLGLALAGSLTAAAARRR